VPDLPRSMPDGTYVADSRPDDNLISYRLQVTVAAHKIAAAKGAAGRADMSGTGHDNSPAVLDPQTVMSSID
jgi:hypothetical protein